MNLILLLIPLFSARVSGDKDLLLQVQTTVGLSVQDRQGAPGQLFVRGFEVWGGAGG